MRKSKMADSFTTVLGPDASIEGTIEFKGAIQLDGRVNGKITMPPNMISPKKSKDSPIKFTVSEQSKGK